jgi:hypothetical protein
MPTAVYTAIVLIIANAAWKKTRRRFKRPSNHSLRQRRLLMLCCWQKIAFLTICVLALLQTAEAGSRSKSVELISLSLDCPVKGSQSHHEQCKFTGSESVFQVTCDGVGLSMEDDRPIGGSRRYKSSASIRYRDIAEVEISPDVSAYRVTLLAKCPGSQPGSCKAVMVPVCDSGSAADLKSALEDLME